MGASASLRRAFQKRCCQKLTPPRLRATPADPAVQQPHVAARLDARSLPTPRWRGCHGSLHALGPLAPDHHPSRRSEGCPGLFRGAGEPWDGEAKLGRTCGSGKEQRVVGERAEELGRLTRGLSLERLSSCRTHIVAVQSGRDLNALGARASGPSTVILRS